MTERSGRWSLRNQLLLALGVTALAWAVGGVVAIQATHSAAARMRDERLVQLSGTVAAFARHELAEEAADDHKGSQEPRATDRRGGLDLRYLYQVWQRDRLGLQVQIMCTQNQRFTLPARRSARRYLRAGYSNSTSISTPPTTPSV